MQNSHRQLNIGLIVIFTIFQLIILGVFGYTPYPDSDGYIFLAKECVAYGEPYPITSKLYDYSFLWNIGAINAVIASLALFNSVVPLLIFYSFLKGCTVWLFYAVIRKICGHNVAFIALLLYVLYPANYGEGTSTLSELPFMFFIFLGIYLSIVRNWSLAGGMMLAVANWFRPMAIIFMLAVIIYYLYKWRKSLKLLTGYAAMIIIIGSLSYQRTGLFLYQAKTGWMALIDYSTDNSAESLQVRENHQWNVNQKDSVWRSMFTDWLMEHPKEYVAQMPRKLINTYVSDNVNMCTFIPNKAESEYMYEEVSMNTLIRNFPRFSAVQWLTIVNLAFYFFLILAALFSFLYFDLSRFLLPISIISLGTLLLLFVGHGEARFHIPFMPFVIMMAALSIKHDKQYE